MILRNVVLSALVILSASVSVADALPRSIRSIEDMPSRWEGVAGDLFQRDEASFQIVKAAPIETKESGGILTIRYQTSAELVMLQNRVSVSEITLVVSNFKNRAEMVLKTDDELIGNLFVIVLWDMENGVFRMRESSLNGGAHRFVLVGRPN